jgi:hypothetical protein
VRGSWRKGSHTEDSKRHVIEGSGKGAFLFYRGSIRGTKIYLAREGSANMFIGPELYLIYFSVMYNLEGLWPYVGPQHYKNALNFGGQRAC